MKPSPPIRIVCRSVVASAVLGGIVFCVAEFVPGSVEGSYQGISSTAALDSVNFTNLRAGRMTDYYVDYPPARLSGRYEVGPDGVVNVYLTPLRIDEREILLFKAYPRLLHTRFVDQSDGKVYSSWKLPTWGAIGAAIRDQDICRHVIKPGETMRRLVYDPDYKLIRTEIKTGPNRFAEEPASIQP